MSHHHHHSHRHHMRESKQTMIACTVFLLLLAAVIAGAGYWFPYDPVKAAAFDARGNSVGKHHVVQPSD